MAPSDLLAGADAAREYLCVDEFLATAVGARALAAAFELGLIDRLLRGAAARDALPGELRVDPQGLGLLCDLLCGSGVCGLEDGRVALAPAFRRALRFRELLEAKLDFAAIAAADFFCHGTTLVADPARFRGQAGLFRLFDYGRCVEPTPENEARARRWIRITTALTRHEAGVCLAMHDFSRARRLLDIGGNSGEFALQLCRRHPDLRAVVFDLPVVCRIGAAHVAAQPEAGRIRFHPGNALTDPLPAGCDLITFKSVLHDWPEAEAHRFLERAAAALAPGGRLLIFERGPLQVAAGPVPFGLIPILLFAHAFRPPVVYTHRLQALGFEPVSLQRVDLETSFFLVVGVKGSC